MSLASLAARYDGLKIQTGSSPTVTFRKRTGRNGPYIDVTGLGLKVRAQFRTLEGRKGTTGNTTLLLTLANAAGAAITDLTKFEISLTPTSAQTALLNPDNKEDHRIFYAVEAYDDSVSPERVYPYIHGVCTMVADPIR